MQTRAAVGVIAAALVALLLGGCASGGGLFRDRGDRAEAARLLLQREADKERALREAEAEAEAARREKDERAEKAQREADEDAERRKREEAADAEQERRHRRELKEAEHDAKIRELHKGSAAPPPEVERYLIAIEKAAAAVTEWAHELSYCAHSSETSKQFDECYEEQRVHRLELKANAAYSDAEEAFDLFPANIRGILDEGIDDWGAVIDARQRAKLGGFILYEFERGRPTFYDSLVAGGVVRPPDRTEESRMEAARRWADLAVGVAVAQRAVEARGRAAVEANPAAFTVAGATSAAAQNAQPAEAPQRADSNCYDGTMMLIRPNETLRDFDARCGPRSPTRADAAR
ncbi:MAG: hypothetical protein OXU53_05380 [Deltaproteobacteria bacterium]|nr:hypothetical protein [Deltaproteobacteria bacterium]